MTANEISICSLIVSTISLSIAGVLGYLKIKEYRRDNRKINVTWHLNGHPDIGDTIFLTNLSSIPILVDYWQVGWLTRKWLRSKFQPIDLFADEDLHLTLQPREREALNFTEQYSFNWHPKNKSNAKLYIQLKIAGRKKPVRLFVYDPNNTD